MPQRLNLDGRPRPRLQPTPTLNASSPVAAPARWASSSCTLPTPCARSRRHVPVHAAPPCPRRAAARFDPSAAGFSASAFPLTASTIVALPRVPAPAEARMRAAQTQDCCTARTSATPVHQPFRAIPHRRAPARLSPPSFGPPPCPTQAPNRSPSSVSACSSPAAPPHPPLRWRSARCSLLFLGRSSRAWVYWGRRWRERWARASRRCRRRSSSSGWSQVSTPTF
mmetsp:Transcript_5292/g.16600  ORF Transcript_5292/g.16600 Transcript_5292/m.16600 type:complete len:225 (+) Transcript_5292:120-794(+)